MPNSLFHYFAIFTTLAAVAKTEIDILAQGIDYIDNDDIAMIFYVTVKNVCKDELELSVNMLQCCETINPDEADCSSMTLIGGDMGVLPSTYVKNLTLIYPNLYLFNRRGVCSIEVIYRNQFKKKELSTDIHFDTTKFCPDNAEDKRHQCDTVDLDIRQNCNPVDCLIKYSGIISYFNPECKRCQKVPVCNSKICDGCFPDVAYSPYNNECGDLNIPITKKDLEDIENNQNGQQIGAINAICHYGKVTERGECSCNEGWTTSTSDEGMYEPGVAQHHLCNIQVGDWNCVNKSRIRITMILIAVLAMTVISKVLLLMCVMTWCYRHFRKPEKICAKELDPGNESIILCEDLDSLDRCLCYELKEQQSKAEKKHKKEASLHPQTVNVSYYPCSPSAFSSIRSSTGSTRYSNNTVRSIDLSNTTTSEAISFPEEGNSDDSDSTNETLFCEDQVSNEIAYGVYCGVDSVGDKDEDEEETEEEGGGGQSDSKNEASGSEATKK